jgi:plasmid maintenance system antidote protein VapI
MKFDPDYVVAPGATLADWIEENGLSVRVTATMCRMKPEHLQRIIDKGPIGEVAARKLAQGTGISAQFWLALEHNYRVWLAAGKHDVT